MAPSIPLVAALLSVSRADLDEASMLQMPVVSENLAADKDECRCPGYYQDQCVAEADQGCRWSSEGSSDGPWCQCLGNDVRAPVDPVVVTLPPAIVTLPPVVVTLPPQPEHPGRFVKTAEMFAIYWESEGTKYWVSSCSLCNDSPNLASGAAGPCETYELVDQDYIDGLETDGLFPGDLSGDTAATGTQFVCTQHPDYVHPVTSIPQGWSLHSENWNCEGTSSSGNEIEDRSLTSNSACAEMCYSEGHAIAAFWHNDRDICRCYDTCDGGGSTVMPDWPNHVMQKDFILVSTDMKCPHEHGDRLFRTPESGSSDVSLAACHFQCQNTATCAHFSYGFYQEEYVCMGCTTLNNEEVHVGFNTYDMEHSTPPVQMINNWDFEGMTTDGAAHTLADGRWIHFLNSGNSGLSNTDISGWQQMGSGAGASGLFNPASNEVAEGSHVLFLNSGDDANYVYQNLLEPFTQTINIEAAVGGGNGGNDGGYRFGLYTSDGTLVQEVAAGVNGAPNTSGSQYITTHMTVTASDHPGVVGQTLQLRLMKNKSTQGHYHYIRFT